MFQKIEKSLHSTTHYNCIENLPSQQKEIVQWDQSSPGNSASHYSDQSMINLIFLAAWVVLDFSKEVPKIH